jgi:hypothetical protein
MRVAITTSMSLLLAELLDEFAEVPARLGDTAPFSNTSLAFA